MERAERRRLAQRRPCDKLLAACPYLIEDLHPIPTSFLEPPKSDVAVPSTDYTQEMTAG
jgi:hypothetical protein